MATIENYKLLSVRERQNRYFSEEFKRKKVREIENNLTTIAEVRKEYQVSGTAVYKWIYKYSRMRKKKEKQIIESKSDTRKIQQLKEQIKELERILGQKQILIDFQEKVIELAEEEYKIDIKKKFGDDHSFGFGSTKKSTPTK